MTASPGDSDRDRSFLGEVARRTSLADAVSLLAVPALLVGVFSLPRAARERLVFDHAAPTPVTAFTAHYVHLDAGHLSGNVGVYAMIVPAVYLLFLLGDDRKDLLAIGPTILLAFPFVLSTLALLLLGRGVLVGFSGLAMAFVGVLPVAFFRFVGDRIPREVDIDDSPVLFFAGTALIALRAAPSARGLAIAAVATLVALAYAVRLGRTIGRPTRAEVERTLRRPGYVELGAVSPILFLLSILVAFPGDPVTGGTVVNLYVHLVGYGLGFIASYITLRVGDAFREHEATAARVPSEAP